ncbi:hypothetical protein SLEP1_g28126 [Rubroshorea leprosula]|uniref:Uncharacterized protein n=1 Tax=Rubroshorea leprosula TaxID=152421 RepID=A0AAV5K220_9ROSI|nr:hypothetical protein SLEP1_g28126 [Rubroshorea leprosula]
MIQPSPAVPSVVSPVSLKPHQKHRRLTKNVRLGSSFCGGGAVRAAHAGAAVPGAGEQPVRRVRQLPD